jgi:hypothetical protein
MKPPDDDLFVLDGGERVRGQSRGEGPENRDPRSPEPAPEDIQARSEQVRLRIAHLTDPIPTLKNSNEGLLGDVLGVEPVSRDQAEGAEQAFVVG